MTVPAIVKSQAADAHGKTTYLLRVVLAGIVATCLVVLWGTPTAIASTTSTPEPTIVDRDAAYGLTAQVFYSAGLVLVVGVVVLAVVVFLRGRRR